MSSRAIMERPAVVPAQRLVPFGVVVDPRGGPPVRLRMRRADGSAPAVEEVSTGGDAPTGYPDRPDPSDAAHEVWTLVERVQQGDMDAFGVIYDRYADTVFRFIYFRVGNRPLAEDLAQETFLRALKRIDSFTWQGRDLGAWLVTIARNLVADHFKSGRYRLEVTTGDVLDADREDRGPEGSPESAVVDHITNVALLTAVKQLSPEQQECIVYRFLKGFSMSETAQAMGKNEGAIKALQYRATRALGRVLSNDPSFDSPQVVWIAPTTEDGQLDVSDATVRAWARAHHHLAPSTTDISDPMRARYIHAMAGAGQ